MQQKRKQIKTKKMKQIFLMALIAFFAVTISTAQTQQGQPKAGCGQGMQMHQGGGGCNCIPNLTDEQMKKLLGVDTFRYMGIEALKELVGTQFCDACFTGQYPFSV